MQKLSDIMSRDVQVIPPTGTIQEAAEMMRKLDVGSLPVCDGQKLVGVITDRDIAIRSTAQGQDPKTARINDVMSAEVAWCFEDTQAEEAARTMRDKEIRRIPIVDRDKKLVGIVALADLAKSSSSDETKAEGLQGVSR
jgi:CBS domain-containing protein